MRFEELVVLPAQLRASAAVLGPAPALPEAATTTRLAERVAFINAAAFPRYDGS